MRREKNRFLLRRLSAAKRGAIEDRRLDSGRTLSNSVVVPVPRKPKPISYIILRIHVYSNYIHTCLGDPFTKSEYDRLPMVGTAYKNKKFY